MNKNMFYHEWTNYMFSSRYPVCMNLFVKNGKLTYFEYQLSGSIHWVIDDLIFHWMKKDWHTSCDSIIILHYHHTWKLFLQLPGNQGAWMNVSHKKQQNGFKNWEIYYVIHKLLLKVQFIQNLCKDALEAWIIKFKRENSLKSFNLLCLFFPLLKLFYS